MKENIDISEFDQLFKQQLEHASATPPAGVWESISSTLGSTVTTTAIAVKTALWVKIGIAAITATVIASVVYIASPTSVTSKTSELENTKVKGEETIPVVVPESNISTLIAPQPKEIKSLPLAKSSPQVKSVVKPTLTEKKVPSVKKMEVPATKILFIAPEKHDQQMDIKIDPAILKQAEKTSSEQSATIPVDKKDSVIAPYEPKNESYSLKIDSSFIFIPYVVTPNGDGLNDEYLIDIKGQESVRIIIRDSKNFRVFETTNKNTAWTCIMPNGDLFPQGDYFVTVIYKFPNAPITKKLVQLKLIR